MNLTVLFMPNDLFTLAGRECVRELFFEGQNLLVCEHGFLDNEGIPVTDEAMLRILRSRHADLLDRTESIIGLFTGAYEFRGQPISIQVTASGGIRRDPQGTPAGTG